jgi:hypothetical protein
MMVALVGMPKRKNNLLDKTSTTSLIMLFFLFMTQIKASQLLKATQERDRQ